MRYILLSLLLVLTGCITGNPHLKPGEPVGPTTIDETTASKLDRNGDGVITPTEIDVVSNSPSYLAVFIWIILAVLISVVLTMMISRWHVGGSCNTQEAKNMGGILRGRASALDRQHKNKKAVKEEKKPVIIEEKKKDESLDSSDGDSSV